MKKFFATCAVLMALMIGIAYAHGGHTDANGGHYDRSTGEYHYHHGYPAHSHTGGICPYDYRDKTRDASSDNTHEGAKTAGAKGTIAAVAVLASIYGIIGTASGRKK